MPEVAKILLRGESRSTIEFNRKATTAVITPGDLIESDGALGVHVHDAADAQVTVLMFALEPMGTALDAEKDIDKTYAVGDNVRRAFPVPGSVIYAWLAAGQNLADGVEVVSNGAGKLQAAGAGANPLKVVGVTEEAVDATGTVNLRIRIRVRG